MSSVELDLADEEVEHVAGLVVSVSQVRVELCTPALDALE